LREKECCSSFCPPSAPLLRAPPEHHTPLPVAQNNTLDVGDSFAMHAVLCVVMCVVMWVPCAALVYASATSVDAHRSMAHSAHPAHPAHSLHPLHPPHPLHTQHCTVLTGVQRSTTLSGTEQYDMAGEKSDPHKEKIKGRRKQISEIHIPQYQRTQKDSLTIMNLLR